MSHEVVIFCIVLFFVIFSYFFGNTAWNTGYQRGVEQAEDEVARMRLRNLHRDDDSLLKEVHAQVHALRKGR